MDQHDPLPLAQPAPDAAERLKLWNGACVTDPKFTKAFQRGGGFSGTAINSTYQIRKATEMWGPMGLAWGVRVLDEQYVDGAPLTVTDEEIEFGADGKETRRVSRTQVIGHEKIHVLRVRLWYPLPNLGIGQVEHFGQTTFVGQNKKGIVTDEEAPKKSLTDAINKCLSMLGFSADVFLGMYDDSKYVAEVTARVEREEGKKKRPTIVAKATPEAIQQAKTALADAETIDELRAVFSGLSEPLQAITKEYSVALAEKLKA